MHLMDYVRVSIVVDRIEMVVQLEPASVRGALGGGHSSPFATVLAVTRPPGPWLTCSSYQLLEDPFRIELVAYGTMFLTALFRAGGPYILEEHSGVCSWLAGPLIARCPLGSSAWTWVSPATAGAVCSCEWCICDLTYCCPLPAHGERQPEPRGIPFMPVPHCNPGPPPPGCLQTRGYPCPGARRTGADRTTSIDYVGSSLVHVGDLGSTSGRGGEGEEEEAVGDIKWKAARS
jgi:hypothetical protein